MTTFFPAISLLINFIFVISGCTAQTLNLPSKYDGFAYGSAAELWGDSSVIIEAFYDPMCPDSRDSWPPLKQALIHYSGTVSLLLHPFPLPYHSNSYISCRALHIANKLNSSSTYPLLELLFNNQERYYNAPTYNMSRAHIIHSIAKLATPAVGKYYSRSAFTSGFNDSTTDHAARLSFKYGCSRGVTGTPAFFVNGFALPDFGSTIDFKKWRSILDPLFLKA